MARFAPMTALALRTVDVNGLVVRGPTYLQSTAFGVPKPGGTSPGLVGGSDAGIVLASGKYAYVPDLIGPVVMANWDKIPYLNGYRVLVETDFTDLLFDNVQTTGVFGYELLLNYYGDSLRYAPTYAPLQMNFYAAGASIWRGMYPTTPWKPEWREGKQPTGSMAVKLGFESRSLLADLSAANNSPATGSW